MEAKVGEIAKRTATGIPTIPSLGVVPEAGTREVGTKYKYTSRKVHRDAALDDFNLAGLTS